MKNLIGLFIKSRCLLGNVGLFLIHDRRTNNFTTMEQEYNGKFQTDNYVTFMNIHDRVPCSGGFVICPH